MSRARWGARVVGLLVVAAGFTEPLAWGRAEPPGVARPVTALDLNGDRRPDLAVGAPEIDAVLVFHGNASGLAATPAAVLKGARGFGSAIAATGDVDRDGFGDLVIADAGSTVTLHRGGSAGVEARGRTLDGAGALRMGATVSSAGDVDGDGYADVIVGSRYAALLYLGSSSGLTGRPAQLLTGPGSAALAVAGGCDLDGDGFADVVVGSGNVGVSAYRGQRGARLKDAVATRPGAGGAALAGDFDGDGRDDLIVPVAEQEIAIYGGTSGGLTEQPIATLALPESSPADPFGVTMSGVGDMDGDGRDDVLVGAPARSGVYLFRGSARGASVRPIALAGPAGSEFGSSVAALGDIDGDGLADAAVGAPGSGRVHLLLGKTSSAGISAAEPVLSGPRSFGMALSRVSP